MYIFYLLSVSNNVVVVRRTEYQSARLMARGRYCEHDVRRDTEWGWGKCLQRLLQSRRGEEKGYRKTSGIYSEQIRKGVGQGRQMAEAWNEMIDPAAKRKENGLRYPSPGLWILTCHSSFCHRGQIRKEYWRKTGLGLMRTRGQVRKSHNECSTETVCTKEASLVLSNVRNDLIANCKF